MSRFIWQKPSTICYQDHHFELCFSFLPKPWQHWIICKSYPPQPGPLGAFRSFLLSHNHRTPHTICLEGLHSQFAVYAIALISPAHLIPYQTICAIIALVVCKLAIRYWMFRTFLGSQLPNYLFPCYLQSYGPKAKNNPLNIIKKDDQLSKPI